MSTLTNPVAPLDAAPTVKALPAKTTAEVEKILAKGKHSRTRSFLLWGGIALAFVGLAVGLVIWRMRVASAGPSYVTAAVERGDVVVTVTATGLLQALTTVEVGAEVTGKLLSVKVEANDLVTKGQVLAEIDPEQLQALADQAAAQVAQAQAGIGLAQATSKEAKLALGRARSMQLEGLLGRSDLEAATAADTRAGASLASAYAGATLASAALDSATARLEKTRILSPIDGSVLSRLVEPGQTVTAGFSTPVLFKLAQDLTQMRLNVDIDEADVGRVRDGLEASFTVEAYVGRRFPSKLLSLENEPKTTQNVVTYQAVLAVDNSERLLRPGMTCTAAILAETRVAVLTVPNAALRFAPVSKEPKQKQAGSVVSAPQHVWLLRDEVPVAVEVVVGVSDGVVTEIISGDLELGSQVIVDAVEPAT